MRNYFTTNIRLTTYFYLTFESIQTTDVKSTFKRLKYVKQLNNKVIKKLTTILWQIPYANRE